MTFTSERSASTVVEMGSNKYYKLIRQNKLKIPIPFYSQINLAVEKDISRIDSKIRDMEKRRVYELDENDLYFAKNLMLIKGELEKVRNNYVNILSRIDEIWTLPNAGDYHNDEDRVISYIYQVNIDNISIYSDEDPYNDFLALVCEYMKNTYNYLGKYGSFDYTSENDFEVIANEHPWYNDIKQESESDAKGLADKASEILQNFARNKVS